MPLSNSQQDMLRRAGVNQSTIDNYDNLPRTNPSLYGELSAILEGRILPVVDYRQRCIDRAKILGVNPWDIEGCGSYTYTQPPIVVAPAVPPSTVTSYYEVITRAGSIKIEDPNDPRFGQTIDKVQHRFPSIPLTQQQVTLLRSKGYSVIISSQNVVTNTFEEVQKGEQTDFIESIEVLEVI